MEVENSRAREESKSVENKAVEPQIIRNDKSEKYVITAYCACYDCCRKTPADKGYGITASGVKAEQGVTVAADTNALPFGTKIYIEGVGERIVQDTGSAIKGKKIDLYFENHQEANSFGRQTKLVTILN